jgi:hypothetical protein
MVMRKIFISKREEVAGCYRRRDKEELHMLCCSPNILG